MDSSMLVPPWLERLLSTTFFSTCEEHIGAPRNECNLYCLDCWDPAFCFYCRSTWHKDHRVIQIRRSSYHDVVRVAEIEKALDVDGVQTYVINSARVIFLNERPQPRATPPSSKTTSHLCETCRRSLLDPDPVRFCSLGCKLVGVRRNIGGASFVLSAKEDEEMEGIRRRLPSKEEEEEMRVGTIQSTPCPPQACSNSRRRKGIPRRAPLE